MIMKTAKQLKRKYPHMEFEDLIGYGNLITQEDKEIDEEDLYKKIRNICLKENKYHKHTVEIYDNDNREGLIQKDVVDFDILALNIELEKLRSEDQVLINMFYYQNYSQIEIAEIFNVSQPAISRKLERILKYLKYRLES